jgi:protein-tyrosine phosphatase
MRILMVCLGNVCRSPMARFILEDMLRKNNLDDKVKVESAGTCYDEIGNDTYLPVKEVLDAHNIPYVKHCARIIEKEDYDKFDLIIAMDNNNIRLIYDILGERKKYGIFHGKKEFVDSENKIHRLLDYTDSPRDIEDPWYTRRFDKVYGEIYEGCEGVLNYLKKKIDV